MSASTDHFGIAEPRRHMPYSAWWGLAGCAVLMAVVAGFGVTSDGARFPVDRGDFWYYWQLAEPTFWTRVSAWLPYCMHQLAIWFLISQARSRRPRYIFGLHSFNVWAIGINAFFVVLHIVQTRFFYDGLAQDVHELTSMMSVVLMLFLIMLMENRRRGLFIGKPVKFLNEIGDVVRRYHGYYFSWAIIYTFWYHPVEITSGHLLGFGYMLLLLLQSSLMFTRYHTNRWWTMSLEMLFVIHGAVIAYTVMQQGGGGWSMFLFGGVATFLITQLHGLGLQPRHKTTIAAVLIAGIGIFYWMAPEYLIGLPRLPAIMYIGTVLMFLMLWPAVRISKWLRQGNPAASVSGPDR